MAGFDDAALRVVHQDGEPSAVETIDAGDPGGVHLRVAYPFSSAGTLPNSLLTE